MYYKIIHNQGGHFQKRDKKGGGHWVELTLKESIKRTAGGFRTDYTAALSAESPDVPRKAPLSPGSISI